MNKKEYLNDSNVKSFIEWVSFKLDKPNSFMHSYVSRKTKQGWECDCIYSAYENYSWPFSCFNPTNGKNTSGRKYSESESVLSQFSSGLCQSVEGDNPELITKYCLAILEWGGVLSRNREKVLGFDNITNYLKVAMRVLDPNIFDSRNNLSNIKMNSGFTKIYSMLIDDFVIYDGRVGAALGLLARKFCEDLNLDIIPENLKFAYGNAREANSKVNNRRNPSTTKYKFPMLTNSDKKHIENNLKANWLLKEIIAKTNSKFNELEENRQLRALEAALFMIGYDVNSAEA